MFNKNKSICVPFSKERSYFERFMVILLKSLLELHFFSHDGLVLRQGLGTWDFVLINPKPQIS